MNLKNKFLNNYFKAGISSSISTFDDYFERMVKIATTMFEWKNLPDTMDARYLELCLCFYGCAAFLYSPKYGFINTQAVNSGNINIYGLPTQINCFSYSFHSTRDRYIPNYKEELAVGEKSRQCIFVLNNNRGLATAVSIYDFASLLANAAVTADINILAQKTPLVLFGTNEQRLTLENVYAQYNGNAPVIFGNKDRLSNKPISAIKTEAPFVADKIMDYKDRIWNEFLTFIGVSNIQEKKERLIDSEANSNNELINLNMQSYLYPRKQACKEFNDLFGFTGTDKEIDVVLRSDLHNVIKQTQSVVTNTSEGVNNG